MKQTSEFIRQGMTRCLESDAATAWREVEKLRARKNQLTSLNIHICAILIPQADVDIMHAEINATEVACDRTEAEVTALRLRLMLAGALARQSDPGASVDVKTGRTEKMMASVNRDRDTVVPGERQKLAILIDKQRAAQEQTASLYN